MSRESSPMEAMLVVCARFIMRATIAMTIMLKSLLCTVKESFCRLDRENIKISCSREMHAAPWRQQAHVILLVPC